MQQSVRCSRCGSPNYPGQQYCWNCGAQLGNVCPSCGATLEHNAKFCGSCGAHMSPAGMQTGGMQQSVQQQYQGGQQQFTGSGAQQRNPSGTGWAPPPPQQQWGSDSYASDYAPRQSSTPLIILLVVLLAALAGFAYWAFFGNPPWSSGNTTFASQIDGGTAISIDSTGSTATATIDFKTKSDTVNRIEYGTDTSYGQSTEWETTYGKAHSITLPSLTLGSRYYYRIITKDKSDKQSTNEFPAFRAGAAE